MVSSSNTVQLPPWLGPLTGIRAEGYTPTAQSQGPELTGKSKIKAAFRLLSPALLTLSTSSISHPPRVTGRQ